MDISKVDKNLKISDNVGALNLDFQNIRDTEAALYGIFYDDVLKEYVRMDMNVAKGVSEDIYCVLARNTAGGRLRFATNSRYIGLKSVAPYVSLMSHMTMCGSSGYALYEDNAEGSHFVGVYMPSCAQQNGFDGFVDTGVHGYKYYTIYFPLYAPVSELYIGLDKGAELKKGIEYGCKRKILYYGSSITQGGCASRPGNSYQGMVSRVLDCDYLNLGFSGNAKGEPIMADYLAGLEADVFVCDYDHNAPNLSHLEATHYPLVRTYRDRHPETPIVLMSKPDFDNGRELNAPRRDAVKSTYNKMVEQGDKNIYFIDGEKIFGTLFRDSCTVDGCHPNDLGFSRMAEALLKVLKVIF